MLSLTPYFRRQGRRFVAGFLTLIAGLLLYMQIPIYLRRGVDAVVAHAPLRDVMHIGLIVLGLMIAQGCARFLSRVLVVSASRYMEERIRADLWAGLLMQPPPFFDRKYTGDLMALLTNDLNAVRMAVGPALMYALHALVSMVWALSWMWWTHRGLTLAILFPAAISGMAMYWGARAIRTRFEAVQTVFGRLSVVAQEVLTGIREVKAYGMEDLQADRFAATSRDYVDAQIRLARVRHLLRPAIMVCMGMAFLVLLGYGGWLVSVGQITMGTFVAFQAYLTMLAWPILSVGWVLNLWQRGQASWQRIRTMVRDFHKPIETALKDVRYSFNPVGTPTIRGELRVEAVTFAYRPGAPVLRDLTLHVAPGEWVAITGPSASGKSTLLKLLVGLYSPARGTIRWDGVDLPDWPLGDLRRSVVLVTQEPVLFSTSIRNNLLLGLSHTAVSEDDLWTVLDLVQLADEVQCMPEGLDTRIGERGVTLSGGQRQRLALARALLRNPTVLLLDDPFSQVDLQTQQRIWQRLVTCGRTRWTVLLVTQRAQPVADCDRIAILDAGRFVATGRLDTLLDTHDWFRTWWSIQQWTPTGPSAVEVET